MSRALVGSIALACALLVTGGTAYALMTGCGGAEGTTRGTTAAAVGGGVPITLVNDTGVPVCSVLLVPSAYEGMGDNWLAEGESVAPGAERTFSTRGDAQWRGQAYDCYGNQVASFGVAAGTRGGMRGAAPAQTQAQPTQTQTQTQGGSTGYRSGN